MKTTHAVWERENIGVDAWEIALDAQDTIEALAEEERHIIAEGAEYIVLKSPVNCPQLLFGLTGLGYTFVETVFHVEIRRKDYHMPETIARFDWGLTVVIFKHALRNALIPVITYVGPMTAYILTGSMVVETVFTIGGLGTQFVKSINNQDYPMIMATTIFLAVLMVVATLLSDLVYKLVDPRIKLD